MLSLCTTHQGGCWCMVNYLNNGWPGRTNRSRCMPPQPCDRVHMHCMSRQFAWEWRTGLILRVVGEGDRSNVTEPPSPPNHSLLPDRWLSVSQPNLRHCAHFPISHWPITSGRRTERAARDAGVFDWVGMTSGPWVGLLAGCSHHRTRLPRYLDTYLHGTYLPVP